MSPTHRRLQPSWELIAVGAIVATGIGAGALLRRARPAMLRSTVSSVGSALTSQRDQLREDLTRWRNGMLADGRWTGMLAGVLLEARRGRSIDSVQWRSLITAQLPNARGWVLDEEGAALVSTGPEPVSKRHRWLSRMILAGDSAAMAATGAEGSDLRVTVGRMVVAPNGRHLVALLDMSATDELRRHVPSPVWEGQAGRAAITFPLDSGYVGATWTGNSPRPSIGWPARGWSLTDSSLIVVGAALPGTMPRVELAIPLDAARARVEAETARLETLITTTVLILCVTVMLIGRRARNARLQATERTVAKLQLRAAQAESAATRAELGAMQARLNPHFLSNAMHSVSALISTDPEAAEQALDRLGDLFRYALEQSECASVPLTDEWQFVCDYLAIEQMRLGPRLIVDLRFDPTLASCQVPSFALQPLVENAVRHGVSPQPGGGTVWVAARRDGNRVELVVSDDGAGADPAAVASAPGTGLRTLRQRLALEPAFAGTMSVDTAPGRGFTVRVLTRA